METKIIRGLLLLFTSFIFTACQKANIEQEKETSFFKSQQNRVAFAKGIQKYFNQDAHARGAFNSNGNHFIAPFVSNEGWGIFDFDPSTNSLRLGNFNALLGRNDFYRENRDGTVSLHVNSNTALVEYYPNVFDIESPYYFGYAGHFDANYTGPVVTLDFGDFIIKFIDINTPGKAVTIHGNGRVRENGTGSSQDISLKILATPSEQGSIELKIN